MAEVKLITISDFSQFKQILSTVNSAERIDPYILEAQRLDIKQFLGEELYYDFVENVTSEKYVKLLSGGNYSYNNYNLYFNGIKPALVYFSYARFLLSQPITVTQFGVVHKTNQFSEQVDDDSLARQINNSKEIAHAYLREVETFLDRNVLTYTLWNNCSVRTNRGSTRITRVAPS